MEDKREKHFVLVHGSCHGAWCWYKLATLLRSDGHRVTALDLAASGIHPKQMQEVHSISDYLEPLIKFMAALPPEDKVVMVGHSMGGVGLSVAMERFPEKIAFAVFTTALMPGPGLNYLTICQEVQNRMNAIYMDSQFTFDQASDKRHASVLFGPKLLESKLYQLCPPEDQIKMDDKREKHFVLVHGACHGAWCWYKLATLLRSGGHRVTVLDMAASGIHPKQEQEVHSMSDYLEPLMEFMATLPKEEKVVMVGHSLGGVALSFAMERFPKNIVVAVFATAFMPSSDLTAETISQEVDSRMGSYLDSQLTFDQGVDNGPTSFLFGPKLLASHLYQLSPPEDLSLATLLVRPYPARVEYAKPSEELLALTEKKYGSVRRVYVVAEQDKLLPEEVQRWMIELNPPDEVKLIPGADHMLMLSKPQHLSSCLQEIAHHY